MSTEIRHVHTIIIGAGPAGSVCGYLLAKQRQECLIIEKKEFPRDKTCGGGLTPKAVRLLDRIYGNTLQYEYEAVNRMEVYSPKEMLASFKMTDGIRTVARKDFDNLLLDQYKKMGGEVLHSKLSSIEENDGKVLITLNDGIVLSCNTLIGADGATSIVRKHIEPEYKLRSVWMEKTLESKPVENIRIFFNKKYKEGYGYVFPNPKGYVVGYGHSGAVSHKEFDEMLTHYQIADQAKTKGAFIPTFDKLEYEFRKNIILIGDAGSYTDSVTSEGLFYAMKTGENAAISVIDGIDFKIVNNKIILRIRKLRRLALLFYSSLGQWIFYHASKRKFLYRRICEKIDLYIAK